MATLPRGSSQLQAYIEGPGNSLAGQGPSREKDLNFFQKYGFLEFSRLSLATCSWVEALVASLLKEFRGSLSDLLAGGPSSREKHF